MVNRNIYIPGLSPFAFLQSDLYQVNADKYPTIICNSIIYQYTNIIIHNYQILVNEL